MISERDWKRLKRKADAELETYGIQPTEKKLAAIVAAMDPPTRTKFLTMIGVTPKNEPCTIKPHNNSARAGKSPKEAGHDAADR